VWRTMVRSARGTRGTRSRGGFGRGDGVAAYACSTGLDGQRLCSPWLSDLDETLARASVRVCVIGVEVGPELGEGLELAVLRELQLEAPPRQPHRARYAALPRNGRPRSRR